ncbi:HpcH/HpaI aldolase/citrate lyase family protein [Undibacterium crateris]|uniref:HpcH/HpaI aldolase/citrate lyase family protein n=1 Tax=Undibacterium crateris TaxID=2528175 RepID=UPI001389A430|nr:CoA ester lyase [Undibacterium crateris]NDI87628.1 CoA ester lyase [Undibacterium crateris]
MKKYPITYLFVPGNRPDRFDKALDSGADAIIVDLEDSVSLSDKSLARDAFANWFERRRYHSERILLRINDAQSFDFSTDRELVHASGVKGVMLPKTESNDQVESLASILSTKGFVVPIIESAKGVLNCARIAMSSRVQRLAFGNLDYATDLHISADTSNLAYPCSVITIASRAAELLMPIAGVTPEIYDDATISSDSSFSYLSGFGAKLCIHPRQIELVRQAFAPSNKELIWAQQVLALSETSAVAQLDGKMIDRPVLIRAQSILQYYK